MQEHQVAGGGPEPPQTRQRQQRWVQTGIPTKREYQSDRAQPKKSDGQVLSRQHTPSDADPRECDRAERAVVNDELVNRELFKRSRPDAGLEKERRYWLLSWRQFAPGYSRHRDNKS